MRERKVAAPRLPDKVFEEVVKIAEIMKSGGVVIYPTDTIWGIGCDAGNHEAVEKIYKIKERDFSKSMLVLIDRDNKLSRYVKDIPDPAWDILDYATKPTTIIFDKPYNIAENLMAEDGSVGFRVCGDKYCQEIVKKLGRPIVSTSANFSGDPSPKNFETINKELLKRADYVSNYRRREKRMKAASTIIKLGNDSSVKVIRS